MLEFAQTNVWGGSDECVMNSASGARASPRTTEVTVRGGPFEVTVRGGPNGLPKARIKEAMEIRCPQADLQEV